MGVLLRYGTRLVHSRPHHLYEATAIHPLLCLWLLPWEHMIRLQSPVAFFLLPNPHSHQPPPTHPTILITDDLSHSLRVPSALYEHPPSFCPNRYIRIPSLPLDHGLLW